MLVDSNSQRGSVVLRGIEIGLDTDIGRGFVIDCARFTEGLLPEDQIKSKYGLSDNAWARLADNAPLVRAVETEKTRRVRDGAAAREKAQWLFVQAPTVLGNILNDATTSPRHRIEACRELRAVATSGSESTPATGDRVIIRIDLTAGGSEVIEFDKALAIEPGSNKEAQEGDEPFDKGLQQSGDERQSGGGNPFIPAELRALPEAIEQQRMSGDTRFAMDAAVYRCRHHTSARGATRKRTNALPRDKDRNTASLRGIRCRLQTAGGARGQLSRVRPGVYPGVRTRPKMQRGIQP